LTYALDNTSADAGDGPLDLFGARRAHDERAARVDGREEGVAVVEAMLEVLADGNGLVDDPAQLALLRLGLFKLELRGGDPRPDLEGHGVLELGCGISFDGRWFMLALRVGRQP
jgi:hypothetical protein